MKKTALLFGLGVALALPACALADISLPVEPVIEINTFFSSLSLSDRRGGFQTRPYSHADGNSSDSHRTVTAAGKARNDVKNQLDYLNAVRYVMRSA